MKRSALLGMLFILPSKGVEGHDRALRPEAAARFALDIPICYHRIFNR
jgi:hypothetical protein